MTPQAQPALARALAERGGIGTAIASGLSYAWHIESLLALAVLALVIAALERTASLPLWGSASALPLARLLTAGYLYLTFRKAAAGRLRLPRPRDYRDSWDHLIVPLVQAVSALSWPLVALGLAVRTTLGWADFRERLALSLLRYFRQPGRAGYGVLALWLAYVPHALAVSTRVQGVLPLLNPWVVLRQSWPLVPRLARPYVALLALTVIALLCDSAAWTLELQVPVPFAAPIAAHLITLFVPLAQARIWGLAAYGATLAAR